MVPNGWKLTSLGEVCSGKLQTGPFGSQLHAHEYTDEGVPVLMPKDLISFRSNHESAAKIPAHRADDLKKHILMSGDLLFSRRGDVSRFALIESDLPKSLCGTGCLKATPNQEHSPLFLSYFLQKNAVKKWLEQNAVGQTMPNMNTAILSELPLMVASCREEEDKIAKILSKWDKAISTTEKLIETSKQQKKALMQQLLTGKRRLVDPETGKVFEGDWEEVHIGDICEVNPKKLPEPCNELVSFIPMDAVSEDAKLLRTEVRKYIDVSKGFTSFKDSDTLIAKITPCFENGKGAKVDGLENGVGFGSTEFHVLRAKKGICPDFIYFITNTSAFRVRGEINMQGSAGQKRVTTDYLKLYTMVVPKELKEQQKIASVLTTADKEIEVFKAKLAHFKQEKKALMQQLLTGKRRVKVEEMEVA
ncbi:restriction endonuclease subunit S [Vibrio splendidus]